MGFEGFGSKKENNSKKRGLTAREAAFLAMSAAASVAPGPVYEGGASQQEVDSVHTFKEDSSGLLTPDEKREIEEMEFHLTLSKNTRFEIATEKAAADISGEKIGDEGYVHMSDAAKTELAAGEATEVLHGRDIEEDIRVQEMYERKLREHADNNPGRSDSHIKRLEDKSETEQRVWEENHPDTEPSRIRAARDAARS